jgi:hypothetical protein
LDRASEFGIARMASVKWVHHEHAEAILRTGAQNRMQITSKPAAAGPVLHENH